MYIRELKQATDNKNFINQVKKGIIKMENPLLLSFDTGLFWTNDILTQGSEYDDLMVIIDDIYYATPALLKLYTLEEILEGNEENEEDAELEKYIPLNGGEYYTDMILSVEEL